MPINIVFYTSPQKQSHGIRLVEGRGQKGQSPEMLMGVVHLSVGCMGDCTVLLEEPVLKTIKNLCMVSSEFNISEERWVQNLLH